VNARRLETELPHGKRIVPQVVDLRPAAERDCMRGGDVPHPDIVVHNAVEQADADVGQVQGAAAQAADLELPNDEARLRHQRLVVRAVKTDQAVALRRVAPHMGGVPAVESAKSRPAVDEHPAREIVYHSVDRDALFQQRQGNRAVRDSGGVVVRAIDRIEHPAEPRHGRDRLGRGG